MLISEGNLIDLIDSIYSNLIQNSKNMNYLVNKAILIPKNKYIEKISNIVMDQLSGNTYIYTNADSVDLTKR